MSPNFSEFRLDADGTQRVLGQLESRIMHLAWKHKRLTVREVWQRLRHDARGTELAYTTIMTVMRRLVAKDFLRAEEDQRAYVYVPVVTREDFRRLVVRRVVDALLKDFAEPAMAQFVERAGQDDPQRLLELKALVDQMLAEQS